MPIISGGAGGASGPAEGAYFPVARPSIGSIDAATYTDPVTGSGALTALVYANTNRTVFALAASGDSFPRAIIALDPAPSIWFGNGNYDPYNSGAGLEAPSQSVWRTVSSGIDLGIGATAGGEAAKLSQVSPKFSKTSGALSTIALSSGAGSQINSSRDVETVTPFAGDGTNNAATCLIQLSPDNVTYSTLDTYSIAAALNLSGVLDISVNVRVPAGWWLKLTATHGTLGTTTHY